MDLRSRASDGRILGSLRYPWLSGGVVQVQSDMAELLMVGRLSDQVVPAIDASMHMSL